MDYTGVPNTRVFQMPVEYSPTHQAPVQPPRLGQPPTWQIRWNLEEEGPLSPRDFIHPNDISLGDKLWNVLLYQLLPYTTSVKIYKLLSILGLRAASALEPSGLTSTTIIPNYGPDLMFHFLFAYGILSSRTLKRYYKIDHNVSPQEDLTKYGEAARRDGKLTRPQLELLRRNEAAHANAVENYTLLVAAIVLATGTGV
ncbi:hypothetical protein BGW36DRAFT_361335 [Talaromyces proteolyticus]|uniref:Uncharacterized protein n=1 Tax=Talaromyces proteolyticus TaxID=1131652 RepID=A0AAD4KSN6_9EURO|nr:uncharacterized protein BGW36DRAFT_361335 [Talaromyces proteolyticus]KAH8695657.1 hypothetical protein BGW36DRAFT_361335 [Talaromyces proteolyticus]